MNQEIVTAIAMYTFISMFLALFYATRNNKKDKITYLDIVLAIMLFPGWLLLGIMMLLLGVTLAIGEILDNPIRRIK